MRKEAPKQPDRVTVTMGEMHPPAVASLKAGKARNMSALVRQALRHYLDGDRPTMDPRPIVLALDLLRQDLARVGSNLNQLAHGFNMRGPVAFNRDELAVAHADLRGELGRVMGKLLELEREFRKLNR